MPGWLINQIVIRDTDEEVVASSSRSNAVIAVEVAIFAVLGCFADRLVVKLQMFQDNLLVPYSSVKHSITLRWIKWYKM